MSSVTLKYSVTLAAPRELINLQCNERYLHSSLNQYVAFPAPVNRWVDIAAACAHKDGSTDAPSCTVRSQKVLFGDVEKVNRGEPPR